MVSCQSIKPFNVCHSHVIGSLDERMNWVRPKFFIVMAAESEVRRVAVTFFSSDNLFFSFSYDVVAASQW